MNINILQLQDTLCTLMCAEINIVQKNKELLFVETPFLFPDGDPYQMYIREMPGGNIRLSDMGHTLMHLSYDHDIDKLREGTRAKLLEQIKAETGIDEELGEFFIDTPLNDIGTNLFRFGQAITKLNDLSYLNRARAESTFYDDLQEQLYKIIGKEKISKDYTVQNMENANDYPIDYKIDGKHAPLFVFGIPNRDKARLTTIILERLLRNQTDFDSLLIFSDQGTIPKQDLARLSNAGGEMIASLDAETDFSRKLLRKVG
jgi:hypothetical protein